MLYLRYSTVAAVEGQSEQNNRPRMRKVGARNPVKNQSKFAKTLAVDARLPRNRTNFLIFSDE
jgi:hypothetical protein